MSQVSTEDLIKSIYDAEKKLEKASAQLVLLQNKTHEAKVRYDKSRQNGNQPHCYSVYLQLTTLQGTSAMYNHYMEVKGRQLEWLHYYFMKRTGMCWSDYQFELATAKESQDQKDIDSGNDSMETDEHTENESDMSYDSDAGAEIFL